MDLNDEHCFCGIISTIVTQMLTTPEYLRKIDAIDANEVNIWPEGICDCVIERYMPRDFVPTFTSEIRSKLITIVLGHINDLADNTFAGVIGRSMMQKPTGSCDACGGSLKCENCTLNHAHDTICGHILCHDCAGDMSTCAKCKTKIDEEHLPMGTIAHEVHELNVKLVALVAQ